MLDFLYVAVSWVLLRWHDLFQLIGFSSTSGTGWALSVVFLVITARLLLFRLFIKQVHYQRNMQKMQPKIQKLREKHKDDRATLNQEMMKLQQEEGFNPLTGCLPIFLQFPVFIGLYHVLRHLSNSNSLCQKSNSHSSLLTQYTFSHAETCSASTAKIFNAPLAASFNDSGSIIRQLGGDPTSTRITLVLLLIVSAAATYGTQLMVRANQTTAPEGTAATVQRAMLYLIPLGTLASGLLFRFPLGVLLYWFTSNLWTLGQQAFVIKFHPPTDDDRPTEVVGTVGKSLAPPPGARPVRMAKGSARGTSGGTDSASGNSGSGNSAATNSGSSNSASGKAGAGKAGSTQPGSAKAAKGAPPPGARPARQGGKRPATKRPTQTKKRR